MAQIRVVEKRSGLGWLWGLIALVIVAALVWYFLVNRHAVGSGGEVAPAAPAQQRKDTVILPRRLEAMPVVAPWAAHHHLRGAPPAYLIV